MGKMRKPFIKSDIKKIAVAKTFLTFSYFLQSLFS